MNTCNETKCMNENFEAEQTSYMRLLGWNCIAECKYSCMWKTVDMFNQHGLKVPQFYGKWPFERVMGMQEPASVIFSLLNGVVMWLGYLRYTRKVKDGKSPMHGVLVEQLTIGLNSWLWSAVFHTRDVGWTEKLDYFAATSVVMFAFNSAAHRIALEIEDSTTRAKVISSFRVLLFTLFCAHCSYLSFGKFDYGYNMKFNVIFGLGHSALWTYFWFRYRHKYAHAWITVLACFLTCSALSLELVDFPPWRWVVDAHALWHFLTIPLTHFVYEFHIRDAIYWQQVKYKLV